jgi:lipopolysaccharide biosynthesis protein
MQSYTRGTPVVKDPRFCLLMPAWRQVLGDDTLYVICLRDPLSVARSLLSRDLTDISAGCSLWEAYNVALLRGLNGARAMFVDVNSLHTDEAARLELVNRVRTATDLPTSDKLNDTFDAQTFGPAATSRELIDALTGYQLALYRSLLHLPSDIVTVDDLPHLRTSSTALRILASNFQLANERESFIAERAALTNEAAAFKEVTEHQLQAASESETQLRTQLEMEQAEVERLASERRLDEEARQRDRALRLDPDSIREDLTAARQRLRQLEIELVEARSMIDRHEQREQTFEAALIALRQQLAQTDNDLQQSRQSDAVARQRLEREVTDAIRDASVARAALHAAHALYGQAFSSRSWRWTKPLRREGRAPISELSVASPQPARDEALGDPRIAVVVHMFYPELWAPLVDQLGNLQQPFDLFVSLTEGHSDHFASVIAQTHPDARVRVCPNRGRDIGPFVDLLRSGALDHYDAILKLHSKQSHHRVDGADWRAALWHGLLPDPASARRFADIVTHHPDVGAIVPAGNLHATESIGSNAPQIGRLLARVGLAFRPDELRFPAGSMYWLDASIVELLKAIFPHGSEEFETERGQVDGTVAHAFERVLGVLLTRRGQQIIASEDAPHIPTAPDWMRAKRPRVLAFYLPQYHRTKENDEWWGDDFTDWTNAAAATDWHPDQRFPRSPVEPLGRYDLAAGDVPAAQFDLARKYGVDGFLVYHYWFSGRRLLQEPMDRVLAHPEWTFPYALVWANENWTRTWDGLADDVLIAQQYEPGWVDGLFASLLPHLRDPRYLRVGARPLVGIFKPTDVPDVGTAIGTLRSLAEQHDVGPLHIAGILHDRHVAGAGETSTGDVDSWIEFPPLSGPKPQELLTVLAADGSQRGVSYDYGDLVNQQHFAPSYDQHVVHPGAMPSWDNTPRRKTGASSFGDANPADFRRWLISIRKGLAGQSSPHEILVCINAWNEWAETAYLEPDDRVGLANLEAVRSAFGDGARRHF